MDVAARVRQCMAAKRARGECLNCGCPVLEGFQVCERHREIIKKRHAARRAKQKAELLKAKELFV